MERIVVSGDICMERILQLHIVTEINEHGQAFFAGILPEEDGVRCLNQGIRSVIITRESESGNEVDNIVLFAGMIQEYRVSIEGGVYYLRANCLSASSTFDKERKCRSFQNVKMTYGRLLRQVAGKRRSILVTKNSSMEIPHPFIQYEETDWGFLRRIAGHLETVVVSDSCHLYPQVSVGMVQGKTYQIQKLAECEIEKNIKDWRYLYGSGPMSNSFSLKIEGTLEMNLCDKVIYNGIKFVVLKKEVLLSDGVLNCSCRIGKEKIKIVGKSYNNLLCGLRLSGTVEAVSGVKMKIKLAVDKIYEEQELYEFTYLPITGNAMYAMPAPGSSVHLYFPDNDEKNAFVLDCFSSDIVEGRAPAYRFLEDEQNKFMNLFPEALIMGTGNKEIGISDKNGVEFISDKKICLHAKGDIIFRNGGIVNMQSRSHIHLGNGSGDDHSIHMEGVECTIKTTKFLTSDAGKKAEQVKHFDLKMAWRAAETAKNTVPKVLGALPSSSAEGIGGKVLGGIPEYEGDGKDMDISKISGVKIGGD